MKKLLSIITTLVVVFCMSGYCYAAEEYAFELQYTGTIFKNEEKDANVLLIGNNGTLHSKVRIKVDVTGPATPKITAVDSAGTKHDIVEIGYWGPPDGFAVQGDFTNTTPVKATFPEAGTYKITLSLIDLENANATISQKVIDIEVKEKTTTNENTVTNNTVVEELPKTGRSFFEYTIYISALIILLSITGVYIKNKHEN